MCAKLESFLPGGIMGCSTADRRHCHSSRSDHCHCLYSTKPFCPAADVTGSPEPNQNPVFPNNDRWTMHFFLSNTRARNTNVQDYGNSCASAAATPYTPERASLSLPTVSLYRPKRCHTYLVYSFASKKIIIQIISIHRLI